MKRTRKELTINPIDQALSSGKVIRREERGVAVAFTLLDNKAIRREERGVVESHDDFP